MICYLSSLLKLSFIVRAVLTTAWIKVNISYKIEMLYTINTFFFFVNMHMNNNSYVNKLATQSLKTRYALSHQQVRTSAGFLVE